MTKLFALLFLGLPFLLAGQLTANEKVKIDSLQKIINSSVHDSLKVNALRSWDNIIYDIDPIQDSIVVQEIISISRSNLAKSLSPLEQEFFHESLGIGLQFLGEFCTNFGYYHLGIKSLKEVVGIYQKLELNDLLEECIVDLGDIYFDSGNLRESIIQYDRALKLSDKSGNLPCQSNALMCLGSVYLSLNQTEKSIVYFKESCVIAERMDNPDLLASIYVNMGGAYLSNGDLDSSLICFRKSLGYDAQLGNDFSKGAANTISTLGAVHFELNNLDSSLYYLSRSMKIREELNLNNDLVMSYAELGNWYAAKGNSRKAIQWSEKAYNLAQEYESIVLLEPAAEALYQAYILNANYKKGFETYLVWRTTLDSIQSESNQREMMSQEIGYEYEKSKIIDSLAFVKQNEIADLARAKDKEKETKEKYILYSGLGFATLLIGVAFIGYRRKRKDNRIILKQKEETEKQKEEIKLAHQEITDSIAYAKRIQNAILPSNSTVKTLLPNAFIFFKPKDIVAGDFYWMEQVDDEVIFAAADCTGHGVPGAMVSVVCNGALNRSVREFKNRLPSKILDTAREIVIEEFGKSDEDVNDGMDIAICSLKGNLLNYAGANNPLWIVRGQEIIEFKANKQPIGVFRDPKPFVNHEIIVKKGDLIYIFSDGYVDQFGGEKGKKFKPSNLRALLLSIQKQSMEKQKEILNKTFEDWRGRLDQVDDVCVIGLRIC
ncbi:MAG: tetratricopeptide repeat protein [Crocinitomicaceae bacterium]